MKRVGHFKGRRRSQAGFTIVELLIVIVVIAILAAITVVAYNGIQTRSRDSIRADAIAKIKTALEAYRVTNGQYPSATISPGMSGWEASTDTEGSFMEYLEGAGFSTSAPVDPTNNSTYRFLYHRYPPGGYSNGCDTSLGAFYVLRAEFENAANKPTGNSITTECTAPQPQWSDTAGTSYVWHAFENP